MFIKIILFLFATVSLSAGTFDKAWEAFKNNDDNMAVEEFINATDNATKQEKVEAYSMVLLLKSDEYDTDEILNYLEEIYENADDPSPYFMSLYPIISLELNLTEVDEDLADFIVDITEENKLNPFMKVFLIQALTNYYEARYEYDEAKRLKEIIGGINKWSSVGTFPNFSGSGFDREFGPLEGTDKDSKYLDSYNSEIGWLDLKGYNKGDWIFLTKHYSSNDGVIYSQSFCESPEKRKVQLRLGTSGAVKMWLNDELLVSIDRERNNDIDTYVTEATLEKGWNRILIKTASSEISSNNFLLRITDENGKVQDDLNYSVDNQNYTKKSGTSTELLSNPFIKYFEDKVKESDNLTNYFLLNQQFTFNDKVEKGIEVLRNARELAPKSSYITKRFLELYIREGNSTLLKKELEKLKEQSPNDKMSLNMKYEEVLENENYREAEKILDKIAQLYGKNSVSWYSKSIALNFLTEEFQKLTELIEEAYDKYPYNTDFVIFKYSLEKNVKKRPGAAEDVLEDYLDDLFSYRIAETLIEHYFSESEVDDAFDIYDMLIRHDDNNPSQYVEIADVYSNLSQYDKAHEYYQKATEYVYNSSNVNYRIANNYKQQGNIERSKEYLQKSIDAFTMNYDARDMLHQLQKSDIWDLFEQPDLKEIYENETELYNNENYNVAFLHDEVQTVIYEQGGMEQRYYLLMKALTKTGASNLQEYSVPVYSNQQYLITKAEVLKEDGSNLKAEEYQNKLVFTNLEPGDAVMLEYRIKTYQYPSLIEYFWDKYKFNGYIPVVKSKYSIAVEGDKEFNYVLRNSDKEPKISKKENYKIYEWDFKELEILSSENYSPSSNDEAISLFISSIMDWEEVADWYDGLTTNKIRADYFIKDVVNELTEGIDNDKEKAEAIYDYIVNNISYSSIPFRQSGLIPQKASDVIHSKLGDCKDVSSLFVTMCETAGLEADLVLVNTRNNGTKNMPLPSIDFNHCIAKLEVDDQKYFVELTSDKLPFCAFNSNLKNALALEIDENKNELIKMNPETRKKNLIIRNCEMQIEEDAVKVIKDNIKTGAKAASMRYTYADVNEEDRFKKMYNAIIDDMSNVELKDFKIDKLDTTCDSVTYYYVYESNDPFTSIKNMKLFKIPWAGSLNTKLISTDERKYDLQLWKYTDTDKTSEEFTIKLPEGYKFSEIPKTKKISNDIFDYTLEFNYAGDELKCKRTLLYKKDEVKTDYYKKFKEDVNKINKADKEQLAIEKVISK